MSERPLRVLRAYHSAVIGEYRERERVLSRRHGHDVHLVCPPVWNEGGSAVRAEPDDEIPVHVIARRGPEHPILFWYATGEFRRVLREVQPDIVDLHEEPYSVAVAAALWAVEREAPQARVCVYTAQNIEKRYAPPIRQLERRAMRRTDAVYPCSTEAGEVMRSKGYRGSLHVIPLGVSVPDNVQDQDRRQPPVIGFVGRLEPYKGGLVALEAFARVSDAIDAVLEIVGGGSQEAALRKRAAELGIGSRVVFVGPVPQDEALERIAAYAAVLVPSLTTGSWKEQFGRVAAQAMAAGTPVIASDSGSLAEVVADSGLLVPEGDPAALGAAIARLLDGNGTWTALSTKSRLRARQLFAWDRVSDEFDRMYRDVLRTTPGSARPTVSSSGRMPVQAWDGRRRPG